MNRLGFHSYHPATQLCYFVAVFALSLASMHPVVIIISIMMSLIFNVYYNSRAELARMLRFGLPLAVLVTLINPLVNHRGQVVLLRLFGRAVTLEALLYGAVSGMMLLAVVLWFGAFFAVVPGDRLQTLLGKRLASTALVLTMTLRLVPLLVRRQQEIADTLSLLSPTGGAAKRPAALLQKAKRLAATFTVLLGCALEDSLDTARSMTARGYGAARRTRYRTDRFKLRDIVTTAAILILFGISMSIYTEFNLAYAFYPVMRPVSLAGWEGLYYLLLVLLAAVPFACDGWEAFRWSC
ncbi:MAG: energy-coupling factor transporter transmembrane component T [Acetanaerobacterium sp.]